MDTRPRQAHSRTRRRGWIAACALLAAGFAAALLPPVHWALGAAATAMAYLVGTAVLITVGIVAVHLAGRTVETKGRDQ